MRPSGWVLEPIVTYQAMMISPLPNGHRRPGPVRDEVYPRGAGGAGNPFNERDAKHAREKRSVMPYRV